MSVSWRSRLRRINRLSTRFTRALEGVGVGEDLEDSETQQQQLKPTKSVLSSSICSMPRVRIYSGEARRATHFPTMQIRTRRISTREYRRCSHISLRRRKRNPERRPYDDRYKITPPVGPLQLRHAVRPGRRFSFDESEMSRLKIAHKEKRYEGTNERYDE